MSARSNLHDIPVQFKRETEKAWGIADPSNDEKIIWLPKSQCELERGEGPNEADILTAPEWLLIEKGLV
jgi:hypothetical protein